MLNVLPRTPRRQRLLLALFALLTGLFLWTRPLAAWANLAWGEIRQDYPGGPWYCHYQGECDEVTGEGCPDPEDPNVCWL
jgi:hypothetical protein